MTITITGDTESDTDSELEMENKLSLFSGNHLDDATLHIRKFRLYLSTKKLPNDNITMSSYEDGSRRIGQKDMAEIAYFGQSLKDSAQTWFDQQVIGQGGITSLPQLLEKFSLRFKFDEANQWREIGRLSRMHQGEGQTTSDWIREVEEAGGKVRATHDQIRMAILNGLHPEVENQIIQHDLDKESLEDIRRWGVIAERAIANTQKTDKAELTALKKQMVALASKLENTELRAVTTPSTNSYKQQEGPQGTNAPVQSQTFYNKGAQSPRFNNYNQGGQQRGFEQQRGMRQQNSGYSNPRQQRGQQGQQWGQRNNFQQQQQQWNPAQNQYAEPTTEQQQPQTAGEGQTDCPMQQGQYQQGQYQRQPQGQWQNGNRSQQSSNGCRNCGSWNRCPPGQCRAWGQTCNFCHKLNHFSNCCRNRFMSQ